MLSNCLAQIRTLLDSYSRAAFVLDVSVNFEARPGDQAYIAGIMTFVDSSELHFAEFLDATSRTVERLMYRYHYQESTGQIVFRYDNARHRPPLPSLNHKHISGQIEIGAVPALEDMLGEIADMLVD